MEYTTGGFTRLKAGAAPPPTGVITPSVVVSRTSGIGPLAISFDASGTTSTLTSYPYQDLEFDWNFGDNDTVTWSNGPRPGVLKKNRAKGGNVAHVYENPGTFNWEVTIHDKAGNTAYLSGTVSGSDPATVYAGAATICVSSSGLPVAGVNGVPAGAQCFQLATVELAKAKITGANQRLLFCRGDSFTCSGTNNLPAYSGLTIGAYGTGAKPLINAITSTANYGLFVPQADDVRVMDLQATTALTGNFAVRFSSASQTNYLMLRLDGTYISSLIEGGDNYEYVVECSLDQPLGGNGNVGIWFDYTDGCAAMGNSITNCTSVGGNIEHNLRTQRANKFFVSCNTFTNPATSKWMHAYRGDQKDYPGGNPGWAEYAVISDNLYDQGTSTSPRAIQIAPQSDGRNERIRHVIVERNVIYHRQLSASTGVVLIAAIEGIRVRNNLFYEYGGGGNLISYSDGDSYVLAQGSDFAFENNSAVCTHTDGLSMIWLSSRKSPLWTGGKVRNNLLYAPGPTRTGAGNGTQAVTVYTSNGIATPANYIAESNSTDNQVKNVSPLWLVNPPVALADWALQGGSYAVNSGTDCPVIEDFFGTLRSGAMDMGAVSS